MENVCWRLQPTSSLVVSLGCRWHRRWKRLPPHTSRGCPRRRRAPHPHKHPYTPSWEGFDKVFPHVRLEPNEVLDNSIWQFSGIWKEQCMGGKYLAICSPFQFILLLFFLLKCQYTEWVSKKNFCFPWWKRDWNHRWVEGIPLPSSIPVYKYKHAHWRNRTTSDPDTRTRTAVCCVYHPPMLILHPVSRRCIRTHSHTWRHWLRKGGRGGTADRPCVKRREKGGNEGEKGNLLEWKLKKYFCYTKCQSLRSNPSLLIWYAQWLLGIRIIGAWVARTRSIIRVFDGERYEFLGKVTLTMLLLESWNNLRKWLSYSSTSRS